MATQLFLRSTLVAGWDAPSGLHTDPAFWDTAANGFAFQGRADRLRTTRGAAANVQFATTVAGPTAGIILASGGAALSSCYITDPVDAGFTLSGTVTFNMWAGEFASTVNAVILVRLYRLSHDGILTAIITDSAKATELPTTAAAQNWTATPTSTVLEKGDRLVLFTGIDDAPAVNMAAGTSNVSLSIDGPTGAADGDSFVTFTETFGFQTSAPAGTVLHLRDSASAVTVGGVDCKEMLAAAGSSATTAVGNTANGPITLGASQYTKTAGGNAIEWYSGQLDPFTLDGICLARCWLATSNTLSLEATVYEIARVDADGSNPVVWARADAPSISGGSYKLGTTRDAYQVVLSGPDLSVAGGQRLRFRIYMDDNYAHFQGGSVVTGHTHTLHYDGATDSGTGNKSYLTFSDTLGAYSGPPADPVGPYLIPIADVY